VHYLPTMKTFEDLIEIIARLRASDGCPWDREQTYQTLAPMLIEEAYEVIDSAEAGNWEELRDELGDLLFQIVFYGQIAVEQGHFKLQESITRVHDKMVRRHPHVFANEKVENTAHVLANWEKIKAAEREADESKQSLLDGTSGKLPGLLEAYLLTSKAARVGFDWKEGKDIFQKLEEEVRELQAELNRKDPEQEAIAGEIGDLLFVVANIARWYGIEPESALKRTNRKFRHRFHHVEKRVQEDGRPWNEFTLGELDQFWDEAKRDFGTDENK
jgi:tetrapyrrole methylase family protein/MazG family protein